MYFIQKSVYLFMSKYELYRQAQEASNVSWEDSQKVLSMVPSVYDCMGQEGLQRLSEIFYHHVYYDNASSSNATPTWFRSMFASSTREDAILNQSTFFVQTFGGPPLYRERKQSPYTRLVGRHAAFPVTHEGARVWVEIMERSLREYKSEQEENKGRGRITKEYCDAMLDYFRFQSHYIVVSLSYMKEDQLSGGTQIDEGKLW